MIFTNHTKRNNNKSHIVPMKNSSVSLFSAVLSHTTSRFLNATRLLGWVVTEGVMRTQVALLHSVLVKPAEALGKVPAQRNGENVKEDQQSEGVK